MKPEKTLLLLVEDDAIIALSEARKLKTIGYSVLSAHSGIEAVEIARGEPGIDLILMDIDLGKGMDGTEAAEIILKERDIPVVFLSNHTEPDIVDRTGKITSYGYVVKNTGITVLDASIKMAFRLHDAYVRIQSQREEMERANEELNAVNEELVRSQKDIMAGEAALRESEEKLEIVMNGVPVLITYVDRDERYVYVNRAYSGWYGFSSEEMVGKRVSEFLPPPVYDRASPHIRTVLGGQRVSYENRTFDRAGNERYVTVTYEPHINRGEVKGFFSSVVDITERKRAEEEIEKSNIFLNNIIDLSPHAMWISDGKGTLIRINRACCDLLNIAPGEVTGRYNIFADNIVEEQGLIPLVRSVFDEGKTVHFEIRYDTADLKDFHLNDRASVILQTTVFPITDMNGTFTNAVIQHVDITDRRHAEDALLEHAKEIQVLNEIVTAVSQSMELDVVLDVIMDKTLEYFNNRGGLLCLLDESTDIFMPVSFRGVSQDTVREVSGFKMGQGLSGKAAESGAPLIIPDLAEDTRNISPAAAKEGWHSFAGMPILLRDRVIAVLSLVSSEKQYFGAEQLGMMKLIGSQMGNFIENSRLHKQLEETLLRIRRDEEDLRKSEERFRNIVASVSDYVYTVQFEQGRPASTAHGPACVSVTGYTPEEYAADTGLWLRMVHEQDRGAVEAQASGLLSGKGGGPLEHRIIHKDGSVRWVRNTPVLVRDGQGRVAGYDGLIVDITERRMLEEALDESQREITMMADLLEHSSQAFGIAYPDGRLGKCNEAFPRMLGYTREEFMSLDWSRDITPPEWLEREMAALSRLHETGEPVRYEKEFLHKDGTRIPAEVFTHVVEDDAGNPLHYYAFISDITERKRTENALLEIGERFLKIFDNNPLGMAITDSNYFFVKVNDAFQDLLGYSGEELSTMTFRNITHPDHIAADMQNVSKLYKGEISSYGTEKKYIRKNGEILWGALTLYAIHGAGGEFQNFLVMIDDITERREMQEILKVKNGLLQSLFDSSPMAIFCLDREGNVTMWSPSAERMFQWTADEVMGCPNPIVPPEKWDEFRSMFSSIIDMGRVIDAKDVVRARKDGSAIDVNLSVAPLSNAGGEIIGAVGMMVDITDRKRAEGELWMSADRFKLLAQTAGELLQAGNPQDTVKSLSRKVMEHLDCHAFFNFLVDKDKGLLQLNAYAGIPEEEARKIELLEHGEAVCGCVARDGRRIVAERIPTTPDPRTELVKSFGIKAYACHPLFGEGGRVIGTLSFGTKGRETFNDEDLSLMKAVADQVAAAMIRAQNEKALEHSVREKEILMSELKHRVKNNLAIIESFLNLGMEGFDDEKVKGVLAETRARVHTISAVYEQLQRTDEIGIIDLGKYVSDLTSAMIMAYEEKAGHVRLSTDIEDMDLDVKRAVPLGIILNELVTNSFKYAYPQDAEGEIRVRLSRTGDTISLSVADDGPGLPDGFDVAKSDRKGLKIADLLAKQIGGEFIIMEGKGIVATVTFPALPED